MNTRAYRNTSSSGFVWLGDVPTEWGRKRLKYCVDLINEKLDAPPEGTFYIGLENVESGTGKLISTETLNWPDIAGSQFRSGDVLFGKLRPYLAKVLQVQENGICSSELLVLRPKTTSGRYLFYYLI